MTATKSPKPGSALTMDDLEMVLEAIETRHNNFPEEPPEMTFALVLMNIGDRFAPVTCVHGEWEGLKTDIKMTEGAPTCPNGHVLTQGPGLKIGWVAAE